MINYYYLIKVGLDSPTPALTILNFWNFEKVLNISEYEYNNLKDHILGEKKIRSSVPVGS